MLFYTLDRDVGTPVANQDFLTIIGAAVRSWCIYEIDITGGAGATANFTELGLYFVSALGTGGGGAVTADPDNKNGPAAGFTNFTTYSGQPTVGARRRGMPANSNGNRYFWRAPSLERAIWMPGGNNAAAALSFRPITISGATKLIVKIGEA